MEEKDFIPQMLGKRIKRLRESKKWKIEDLASKASVNKNTIVRLEKGAESQKSSLKTIINVSEALGVPFSDLIGGRPEMGVDYQKITTNMLMMGKREDRRVIEKIPGIQLDDLNVHLTGGSLFVGVLEITGEGQKRSHPGEEFLFCVTGKILLDVHGEKITLSRGDGIVFWGSEPHSYNFIKGGSSRKDTAIGLTVIVDDHEAEKLEDLLHFLKKSEKDNMGEE